MGRAIVESTREVVPTNKYPLSAANSNPFLKILLLYIGCTFILIYYTMLIMKFKEILKNEASGWKWYELTALLAIMFVILYNAFVLKDSLVAVTSAICGIFYTIVAGKGRIYCYVFGLMGSGCYIWLSLSNHLWGNALLYLTYYIPMQIGGIITWSRHLKKESVEIVKTKLPLKKFPVFFIIGILGSILSVLILYYLQDKSPVIDGITTFLSILGMYFTVKRLIEQWVIWMIVNGLSFIMWLNIIIDGTKAYSTLVMWAVYFILAIYFYFEWKKEIQLKA